MADSKATGSFPALKLTYFPIAGAAEKVRLAFVLGDVPFEDETVYGEAWAALKPTTPYGQIPLLTIDGGAPITQSDAMLRYAAKLGGLEPTDMAMALKVDEALGLVGDLQRAWMPPMYMGMRPTAFGYPEDFSKTDEGKAKVLELRAAFIATELPKYLGFFQAWIEAAGGDGFLCGPTPTIADCALVPALKYYTLGVADGVPTDCLEGNPAIVAYLARFAAIPSVAAWYEAKAAAKAAAAEAKDDKK